MTTRIPEADWRRLSALKPVALERLCNRILEELTLVAQSEDTSHERYLNIFKLIQDRDKQIALVFDGLSRSNALFKLTEMRRENLLTDQEFAEFSDETQRIVSRML